MFFEISVCPGVLAIISVFAQACRAVRRMCLQFWIVRPTSVLYRTLRADGSRNDLGVRLALLCSPECDGVPLLCFRTLATEAGISNETWGIMGPFEMAENSYRGLLRTLSQLLRTLAKGSETFVPTSAYFCRYFSEVSPSLLRSLLFGVPQPSIIPIIWEVNAQVGKLKWDALVHLLGPDLPQLGATISAEGLCCPWWCHVSSWCLTFGFI